MSASPAESSALELLFSYVDLGWAVLPIWGIVDGHCACPDGAACKKSPGKHPNAKLAQTGVNSATRNKGLIREWFKRHPKGNWAVRCGEPMAGGGHLLVLDVDPRNGGEETLAAIQGLRGELPDTVTQESGGNGRHFAFRSKEPVHDKSIGPGLDIQGAGKYILVEPSKHLSGGEYVWSIGRRPDDIEVSEAPAWLCEGGEAKGRPPRIGDGSARDTMLGEAFALAGMIGVAFPDGNVAVRCPWHHEHSDSRGNGEDSSTVILPPAGNSRFGGFSCKHSHCATRKWEDVLNALPPSAVAEARRKYPLRPYAVTDAPAPEPAPVDTSDLSEDEKLKPCRSRLSYKHTKQGGFQVVADYVNMTTILTYDYRWAGVLGFDEFSQTLRFLKEPPWHPDDAPRKPSKGEVWTDQDRDRLVSWYKRYHDFNANRDQCVAAAYQVGMRNSFHPLRDYLNGLKWDGVSRIDTWTSRYLGTEDIEYTRSVGAKWLISAVARGLNPGCKADHLVIFEGPQGRGKSTALATLVPVPSWFSDTPIDIGNKDAYVALRGKWIVELAELASLRKGESDKTKAFFSSPSDSYRPPYGREMVTIPRSCIFGGSVNHDQYLGDETGNRRYWPIRCGIFDIEGLRRDRDQIWAECVHRYKAWQADGCPSTAHLWWPGPHEAAMLDAEQSEREHTDSWLESVATWIKSEEATKFVAAHGYVTVSMVAQRAIHMKVVDIDKSVQTRIGQILMRGLRWRSRRVTVNGARLTVYSPSK